MSLLNAWPLLVGSVGIKPGGWLIETDDSLETVLEDGYLTKYQFSYNFQDLQYANVLTTDGTFYLGISIESGIISFIDNSGISISNIDNATIIRSTSDAYPLVNTLVSPHGIQKLCEFVYNGVQYVFTTLYQSNLVLVSSFSYNVMSTVTTASCANAVGCCSWQDAGVCYIAVTQQNSNTTSVFTFDGSTLTLLQTFAAPTNCQGICTFLDNDGARCLAITGTTQQIITYRFVSGSFVSFGSPVSTGINPIFIISFYDSSNTLWFSVVNAGSNTFSSYTLVANALVSNGAPVATGVFPRCIDNFQYNGDYFVVVSNRTSNTFSCYKLTSGTFVSTGAEIAAAVVGPEPIVAYEKDDGIAIALGGNTSGTISNFTFSGGNIFTQIGSPVLVGLGCSGLVSFNYLDSIYLTSGNFTVDTITTIQFVSSGSLEVNMLGVQQGAVGFRSYTLGDMLYASTSSLLAKLAGNTTASKKFLSQTGDGINSAAPVWSAVTGSDITGAALTKTDDANITLTLGGSPATALLNAASLTLGWNGLLGLNRGGLNADLSATGGASQVLMQSSLGGAITVSQLSAGNLSNGTTGTGAVALADSPIFTTQITTPTVVRTGATDSNTKFTANSSTAITITPSNGPYQEITLTGNCGITLAAVPSSTLERQIILNLVQDGTGNRTVTWANITFATNSGAPPTIASGVGQATTITIIGTSAGWVGYGYNGLGMTSGSPPNAGFIGYATTVTTAIGSAVSLTSGTTSTIASILLQPGNYILNGNIGYIPAAGTLPTLLIGSINSTAATLPTSPNSGAYFQMGNSFPAGVSQIFPIGAIKVFPTVATTYYLVASATFTVSTLTAYGSISVQEFS